MLSAGQTAPSFRLADENGQPLDLADRLASGPVLLAFFKITCPTCQFAFPYLDRLSREAGVPVVGISQDDAEGTKEFKSAFRVTFPTAIDPAGSGYEVSNLYGITHVPSLFLLERDGIIALSESGFSRSALEQAASRFGGSAFHDGERVPDYKPG